MSPTQGILLLTVCRNTSQKTSGSFALVIATDQTHKYIKYQYFRTQVF